MDVHRNGSGASRTAQNSLLASLFEEGRTMLAGISNTGNHFGRLREWSGTMQQAGGVSIRAAKS
jgi:hypothetical protein